MIEIFLKYDGNWHRHGWRNIRDRRHAKSLLPTLMRDFGATGYRFYVNGSEAEGMEIGTHYWA